jgi:hypothetical protein
MEKQQSFPYLQLFGIVLASLCVTVILFWVWHMVEMRTLKSAHTQQNDSLRADITTLETYIATTGTTSAKTNP